jgi:hypothetical protein
MRGLRRAQGPRPNRRPSVALLALVRVLFALLLAACTAPTEPPPPLPARTRTPAPAASPQPGASPTQQATASPPSPEPSLTPTPPHTPPPPHRPARPHYALTAWLDYDARALTVAQVVTYTNNTGGTLDELLLLAEAARWPGAFEIDSLRWPGDVPVQDYALDGRRLRVSLPEPLPSGAALVLALNYRLQLPERHDTLGHTPRQALLGEWHPFVPPWREGHGWLVHEPAPVGEHLAYELADFDVRIRLASGQGVVLALPGRPERAGDWHVVRLEAARAFAWSASHEYELLLDDTGPVRIESYHFPEHAAGGAAALEAAGQALAIYSELFGPYRRDSFTVVEADLFDGMEYDGLIFLDAGLYRDYDGTPQNYLVPITAHETAHQWWYASVANDPALEPWLDEALSTYSERIFFERVYPHLVDWWWEFRVLRFNPEGRVDGSIYDHFAFRPYVNAVYLRGALFLGRLRFRLGDEAFFAFLGSYARDNAESWVTAETFWEALAARAAEDVSDLVTEFFGARWHDSARAGRKAPASIQEPVACGRDASSRRLHHPGGPNSHFRRQPNCITLGAIHTRQVAPCRPSSSPPPACWFRSPRPPSAPSCALGPAT